MDKMIELMNSPSIKNDKTIVSSFSDDQVSSSINESLRDIDGQSSGGD